MLRGTGGSSLPLLLPCLPRKLICTKNNKLVFIYYLYTEIFITSLLYMTSKFQYAYSEFNMYFAFLKFFNFMKVDNLFYINFFEKFYGKNIEKILTNILPVLIKKFQKI